MPQYQFTFAPDDAKLLWLCIQKAPLPRELTDPLAATFMQQLDEQNKRIMAEQQAKANGHDSAESKPQ